MELLVNDLSIHGQFQDLLTFRNAIDRLMAIRRIVRQSGRELHCHRNVAYAQVTPEKNMQEAVGTFSRDQQLALMPWLGKRGPFWEDTRHHCSDDYLEHSGDVVTDTALGEAAYCCLHGLDRRLVSLIPSRWTFCPVQVTWLRDNDAVQAADVLNYWDKQALAAVLDATPVPLASWADVEAAARIRFSSLTFAPDPFESLRGHPFGVGAAARILVLLGALERLKCCFDDKGQRTPDGHRLIQDHFGGEKKWFSDSSDTEKQTLKHRLTFPHPTRNDQDLFCPWHGKVNTPQLRIHFTWPVTSDNPLFVMYVGPKLTKR